MLIQARWDEMRQKMQVVKNAYVSRHYAQCAKYGERLLAEVQGEIHPIHLAYLNFYVGLSHDTLAREATLKNRYRSLNLAEKHYLAAISALTPPSHSSSSSSQSSEFIWKFRGPSHTHSMDSMSSSYSSASSEMSDLDYTHQGLGSFNFPRPPSPQTQMHRPHPSIASTFSNSTTYSSNSGSIHIPSRPQTPSEFHFACETGAFIRMVRGHVQNVRDMKHRTSVMPSVRFNFPQPPPVVVVQKERGSRVFESGDGDLERKRRERMSRTFRPRFDPEEIRRLCGEVEAELDY